MTEHRGLDRALGPALLLLCLLVALAEWGAIMPGGWVTLTLIVAVTVLLTLRVPVSRKAFVAVAAGLTLALVLSEPGWWDAVRRGLVTTAFIAAFFTALSTLRSAAQGSPAIRTTGRYLASQPPGRRYLALTSGGMMFALLLNYGAIALLGTLATASTREEPDPDIRRIRTRRMLLAIQRGFVATLPWSPMSFAVAISTAMIPGASWAGVVLPGLVTSIILGMAGWALDSLFKPRLSPPARLVTPEGNWQSLLPLALLLAILVGMVGLLHLTTGVRVVGVVMPVVPVIALIWVWIQTGSAAALGRHLRRYAIEELPAYHSELTLLMMAGYIGSVGAALIVPLMARSGVDLAGLPAWVVLVALVWIIPVLGQIGMNPILSVTLLAPLVPSGAALGISPETVVVALTCGWALSGATSPFTATTLLIGSFAGVSATEVGLRWNGGYFFVCALLLTLWVVGYASLAA